MRLQVIEGLDRAREALQRTDPLDTSSVPAEVWDRNEQLFGERLSPLDAVQRIVNDVRRDGDQSLRRYTQLLDGVELDQLEVSRQELDEALESLSPDLRRSLELAAERIEAFHKECMPRRWLDMEKGLGEFTVPLDRVGIYTPGGKAAYPSTVLMTAVPAKVAGVREVVLASPPRDGNVPSPIVLAAAVLSGIDRVFAVGGPQAIAAMAYGTETIPMVDLICGPGNLFVALAKRMVFGQVGIDGIFGPTETLVVADETAPPAFCAADLIAQAEHDEMAVPILVTTSPQLVDAIGDELDRQLPSLERQAMAVASLERQGKILLVDTIAEAIDLANHLAPEHLCLMVENPWNWAGRVRHAGGLFLGHYSPEVMGDYVAGPSHVMPTGGSARFSSALGVHQFLRTMPVVGLPPQEFSRLAEPATHIALGEGLSAHSHAIQIRVRSLQQADAS
jgi:histidinol dehydrogenase